ncbi:MAG: hypothetical protein HDS70_00275 [Bacteroidales bacterium]|nr:hypothetical protein [Bacteroidales bacterium]
MKKTFYTLIVTLFAGLTIYCATSAASDAESKIRSNGELSRVRLRMPVDVNGRDLVSKVFGFIESDSIASEEDCVAKCGELSSLRPSKDEYGLWLEKEDGYQLSCYGDSPEVTAMARFDDENLSGYGFFFIFPYTDTNRQQVNMRQSAFTGALLQELNDFGLVMEGAQDSVALFDVYGKNGNDSVEIRLIEEKSAPDAQFDFDSSSLSPLANENSEPAAGRYVLILQIEPGTQAPAVGQ